MGNVTKANRHRRRPCSAAVTRIDASRRWLSLRRNSCTRPCRATNLYRPTTRPPGSFFLLLFVIAAFRFSSWKEGRRGWRNATTPLHRLGRWWTSIHSDSFYRKLLSAQTSIGPTQPNRKSSSGSDCYVCRDCQLLIENIIYNPVPTVHCDRPSIHVSLPWSIPPPPPPTQLLLRLNNQTVNWMNEHKTNKKWLIENDGK